MLYKRYPNVCYMLSKTYVNVFFLLYCFNGTYDGCQYSIYFLSLDLIPKWLTRDIGKHMLPEP